MCSIILNCSILFIDTVLKEHVASLPNKRRLAHKRASRHSVPSTRSRHKRSATITKVPSVQSPLNVTQEGVQNRPWAGSSLLPGGISTDSLASVSPNVAEENSKWCMCLY